MEFFIALYTSTTKTAMTAKPVMACCQLVVGQVPL